MSQERQIHRRILIVKEENQNVVAHEVVDPEEGETPPDFYERLENRRRELSEENLGLTVVVYGAASLQDAIRGWPEDFRIKSTSAQ